jgi:hypothetical protein
MSVRMTKYVKVKRSDLERLRDRLKELELALSQKLA